MEQHQIHGASQMPEPELHEQDQVELINSDSVFIDWQN